MAKRKQHTAAFKAQVALAALRGDKTVNELAAQLVVPSGRSALVSASRRGRVNSCQDVTDGPPKKGGGVAD